MTVDPEHDTPERLKEYAEAFGAGPGWFFVTGRPDDIRAINYTLGERSRKLSEHRNQIVLGNEPEGQWQRDSVFGDIDGVVDAVRRMDPKWRDEGRNPPSSPLRKAGPQMSHPPRGAPFRKLCA